MKTTFYFMMVFQMLVGIWMFISPFVYDLADSHIATSNMIFGAITVLLGLASIFFAYYGIERAAGTTRLEHAEKRA